MVPEAVQRVILLLSTMQEMSIPLGTVCFCGVTDSTFVYLNTTSCMGSPGRTTCLLFPLTILAVIGSPSTVMEDFAV